jgi:hypothetical protein
MCSWLMICVLLLLLLLLPGLLSGRNIIQVAAGRYHSLAVTAEGEVITWGLNDFGQLGRQVAVQGTQLDSTAADSDSSASTGGRAGRHLVDGTAVSDRHDDSTSASAAQGAELEQSGPAAAGSCGSGWFCHSGAPGVVAALGAVKVVAAAAGRYSTLVLDDEGQLWTWGYDGCAGGLPAQPDMWRPRSVGGELRGEKVVAFDVGEVTAAERMDYYWMYCNGCYLVDEH